MRTAQFARLLKATRPASTWEATLASIANTDRLIRRMDAETQALSQMGDR